ncbi:MAG: RDD family protein [Cyclobacteriaceae bacterium]
MAKFITNQNIELQLELASLGDRIVAYLIDALILGAYFIVAIILGLSLSPNEDQQWVLIIFYLPAMFYSLFFEVWGNGQSPGKKARNIKVVKLNGGSPEFVNYLLRWILRPIDILLYGAIAIVSIIITKNGQRVGDLAAGTTVVKIQSKVALSDVKTIVQEDHEVKFPQVKRLSDSQIELIRKALHMRRDGLNGDGVDELDGKLRDMLQIKTEMPPVTFLYTLVKDYEFVSNA